MAITYVTEVKIAIGSRRILATILLILVLSLVFTVISTCAKADTRIEFVCVTNITDICSAPKPASDVEFLSDDTNVIVAGTYRALWNVVDGNWMYIGLEQSLAISVDRANEHLASAVRDANVRIYNISARPPIQEEVVRDTEDSTKTTQDVVFGRDSSMVITSGFKEIYKWIFDGYRWRLVDTVSLIEPTSDTTIWALFYENKRDLLVAVTNLGDCYIMDTALSLFSCCNNTGYAPPDQGLPPPYYTPFDLLGNWTILWCSADDQYVFLNLSTGKYSSIPLKLGPFHHICQSHSGEWVALVSHGQVAIHNSSTLERVTWFLCSDYVTGITWSQDDRYIATTDEKETLQIWVNIRHPGFNHPPNIEILSHKDGDKVANTIVVFGNATDDHKVMSVLFKIDDGDWQFANGSNNWLFLWDTRFNPNGLHRLSLRAFDGEKSSIIVQVSLFIDNNDMTRILPMITIDEPINSSIVSGAITVKGRAWGPNPIKYVQISYSELDVRLDVVNGNWSTIIDTSALPNGPFIIEAMAFDGLWYSSKETLVLTVRNNGTIVNKPPSVMFIVPESNEVCSLYLTVRGSATDEERRLRFVLVRVDNGTWQSTTYEDEWPYEWNIGIDTWRLENGPHWLFAICADDLQFSEIVSVPFVVDNDIDHPYGRPNIVVSFPANGSIISGTLVVSGSADTEPLIKRIEYSMNGTGPLIADGKVDWSFSLDTTARPNGPCELRVWASGYVRDSDAVVLSLTIKNNKPPACTIDWPINNQTFIEDIEIRGTASDPEGEPLVVEIQFDDSKWYLGIGNLSWSIPWEIENITGGQHTVRARSFDGAKYSDIQTVDIQIFHPIEPIDHTSQGNDLNWILIIIIVIIIIAIVISFLYLKYRK